MLPPREAMGGEGLRFVAVPSLRRDRYAIALWLPNAHDKYARGVALAKRDGHSARMQAFYMPSADYSRLVAAVDARMDWDMGDYAIALCFDGLTTSFERIRGPLITSGQGYCDDARSEVASHILRAVRPYAAPLLTNANFY